jgi:hypothetical protein
LGETKPLFWGKVMGYLLCKLCGGYYELRQGEKPEDFLNCQCLGELEYYPELNASE